VVTQERDNAVREGAPCDDAKAEEEESSSEWRGANRGGDAGARCRSLARYGRCLAHPACAHMNVERLLGQECPDTL
jgi:hypothetical protein